LARDHTIIGDVRGRGLAIGVDLVDNPESKAPAPVTTAAKVILRCYQLGVHLLYVGLSGNVLELTPALTIGEEEISQAIDVLDAALADVAGGAVTDDQVAPYMMW
jgi:4-aminobutyrate aminotransferase